MQMPSEVHEWWETLKTQMGSGEKGAGFLYVYDPENKSLSPRFPARADFKDIPSKAIAETYEAAREGRLAALRPDDLSPHIVTTDPENALAEVPADVRRQGRALVTELLNRAQQLMQQSQMEQAAEQGALNRMFGSSSGTGQGVRSTDLFRSAYSAREALRLANAAALMPAPRELRGETDALLWQVSILAAQAEAICVQRMRDEEAEEERRRTRERERQFQAAFILSQGAQEGLREDELDLLLSLRKDLAEWEVPEDEPTAEDKKKANVCLGLLNQKENLADEEKCHHLIDDIVTGKDISAYHQQPAKAAGEPSPEAPTMKEPETETSGAYGTMLGSALRQFMRYAASEVPLSVKHAEVGRQCRTLMKMAEEAHLSGKDMGLSRQEYMAVMGTIELGKVVKRGLEAEQELIGGKIPDQQRKAIAMRDYLSMKALEQALVPHVAAHQDDIETGEGPLSSIQLLMGNPGFSARDIHRMVSWSEAMAEFLATPAEKLPLLLRQEGKMALLGQRAMAACYDSDLRRGRPVREQPHAGKEVQAVKGPAHQK